MIVNNIELIIRELIFLLPIMLNVISRIIKGERESNCLTLISIDDIDNRGGILLIDKSYKINSAS